MSRSKRNAALQVSILFSFLVSIFHCPARLGISSLNLLFVLVNFCCHNLFAIFVADTNELPISTK